MINVETIDLSPRGVIFPHDSVGIVIAQPFIPLTQIEPYKCISVEAANQAITKTLELALARPHGLSKTHFTIFPEYSIPGVAGIETIEGVLQNPNWPSGTVVIGGTDALSKTELITLASKSDTHINTTHNALARINADEWINCGITWIKVGDGKLERWLQPKLHPAWDELNISYQSMFCGRSLYAFKGKFDDDTPFRFATVVCFDWIATIGSKKTCSWILDDLHAQANNNGQLPLSWLFVIQRNEKPSHHSFLTEVETFFDRTQFKNAIRDRACLIFVNQAGKSTPGRTLTYGGCSVVAPLYSGFVKPDCAPTYSNGGPLFRDGSEQLSSYRDAFFRERGACIHSFRLVNPGSVPPGSAGKVFAVQKADVFPIDDKTDPRVPGAGVPASIKWFNDELDEMPSLASSYKTLPFASELDEQRTEIVASLRNAPPSSVENAVKLATAESKAQTADQWTHLEGEAIEHVLNTANIIALGGELPTCPADPAHATFTIASKDFDVLAIRGNSHERCLDHSKSFVPSPRRKSVLVTRDKDNNDWLPRLGTFLEPEKPPGEPQKFTDPYGGVIHLGYRKLIDIMQASATTSEVQGAINDELSA